MNFRSQKRSLMLITEILIYLSIAVAVAYGITA
jgi:hypothetical protein